MSEQSDEERVRRAIVAFNAGCELRDAGRSEEAIAAWDGLAGEHGSVEDRELALAVAQALYAKAHLLMKLGRYVEATAAAGQSTVTLADDHRSAARLEDALARTIQSDSLARLGQFDQALVVDDALIVDLLTSDEFELRDQARRAMARAIWVEMTRGRSDPAIAYAQRLLDSFRAERDPERLARSSEQVLSSAAHLDWRRSRLRRVPEALRTQASAMREAVIEHAGQLGGDTGGAVILNAQIAAADALVDQHHLFQWLRKQNRRPALTVESLSALKTVADHARQTGATIRYIQLAIVHAEVLDEAGQRDDAIRIMDDVIAEFADAQDRSSRSAASLARTVRNALAG